MKKTVCILIIMSMILSVILTGCSNKMSVGDTAAPGAPSYGGNYSDEMGAGKPDYDNGYDNDFSYGAPSEGDPGNGAGMAAGVTDRKRIQYVTVDLETLEYDRALSELKARATAVGGYIESSRETGQSIYGSNSRRAELVLRIPTGELDGFTENIAGLGSVLSQYTTTDDVTDSYFDTEARLASLELQRDKYMELLDRADDMVYIIELTNALTEVIYQIERYTGMLNKYDSLIAYSTVTVNLSEVIKLTEKVNEDPTFAERIGEAFSDSVEAFVNICQGFVVGLAAATPFLILPAAVVVVVIIVVNARSKKRRARSADRDESDKV